MASSSCSTCQQLSPVLLPPPLALPPLLLPRTDSLHASVTPAILLCRPSATRMSVAAGDKLKMLPRAPGLLLRLPVDAAAAAAAAALGVPAAQSPDKLLLLLVGAFLGGRPSPVPAPAAPAAATAARLVLFPAIPEGCG
jgi:hypothetical protein